MLTTAKTAMHLSAIAIGIVIINFPILQTNAQSTTADSFNFEAISVGEGSSWNFSSKDETASLQDEIQNLGEYSISSDADNFNVRLVQENRVFPNRTNRPYYYIENRIAPYYFIKTRIYDY